MLRLPAPAPAITFTFKQKGAEPSDKFILSCKKMTDALKISC